MNTAAAGRVTHVTTGADHTHRSVVARVVRRDRPRRPSDARRRDSIDQALRRCRRHAGPAGRPPTTNGAAWREVSPDRVPVAAFYSAEWNNYFKTIGRFFRKSVGSGARVHAIRTSGAVEETASWYAKHLNAEDYRRMRFTSSADGRSR